MCRVRLKLTWSAWRSGLQALEFVRLLHLKVSSEHPSTGYPQDYVTLHLKLQHLPRCLPKWTLTCAHNFGVWWCTGSCEASRYFLTEKHASWSVNLCLVTLQCCRCTRNLMNSTINNTPYFGALQGGNRARLDTVMPVWPTWKYLGLSASMPQAHAAPSGCFLSSARACQRLASSSLERPTLTISRQRKLTVMRSWSAATGKAWASSRRCMAQM